ncbi:unnamed protein product [Timema podura]|uniref:Uncharacterized protein n=1 Tax=Timema podura TaxID=61482 RepID=A0ABN7NLE6_TIMPD|nr:unnamed protein product [Timema podura]
MESAAAEKAEEGRMGQFKNLSRGRIAVILDTRHPGDNPFYSNIDCMPDIRRRKSIPLVSELSCESNRVPVQSQCLGNDPQADPDLYRT